MKANYRRLKDGTTGRNKMCFTEKQLEEYLNDEWKKKEKELYNAAIKDASAQILAVMFSTLYKPPYNWRKQRLLSFKKNVEATFRDMQTGILGKEFNTLTCIDFMKREFGIDFDKEVEIR